MVLESRIAYLMNQFVKCLKRNLVLEELTEENDYIDLSDLPEDPLKTELIIFALSFHVNLSHFPLNFVSFFFFSSPNVTLVNIQLLVFYCPFLCFFFVMLSLPVSSFLCIAEYCLILCVKPLFALNSCSSGISYFVCSKLCNNKLVMDDLILCHLTFERENGKRNETNNRKRHRKL